MAQKTVVLLEDDLDGGTADRTVRFSLDGVDYEIDLSDANAAKLSEIVRPFAAAARRVGAGAPVVRKVLSSGPAPKADPEQLHAIRAWARSRGYDVKERGRIPRHIVEQYNSGGSDPAPAAEAPTAKPAPKAKRESRKNAARHLEAGQDEPLTPDQFPDTGAPQATEAPKKPRKTVDLRFSASP